MGINRKLADLAQFIDSSSSGESITKAATGVGTKAVVSADVQGSAGTFTFSDSSYIANVISPSYITAKTGKATSLTGTKSMFQGAMPDLIPQTTATYDLGDSAKPIAELILNSGANLFLGTEAFTSILSSGTANNVGGGAGGGGSGAAWYGARGLFAGGDENAVNIIDYITIASPGNAADFGDLTVARRVAPAGASNGTRAIFAGGRLDGAPFMNDTIDYVTTATLGNATDFGNCTTNLGYQHATSNGVLALILGGDADTTLSKLAQHITIDTASNATAFGSSVTQGTVQGCGCSNGTYSVSHAGKYYNEGGFLQGSSNIIYYMTIATSGDTTDFGDLNTSTYNTAATSDTTRGLFSGGQSNVNTIDYVIMATPGNATDFGDLTQNTRDHAGVSDATYGVFGGNSTGTDNVISYVTIQSAGNAADFGDLTAGRHDLAAASGSAS